MRVGAFGGVLATASIIACTNSGCSPRSTLVRHESAPSTAGGEDPYTLLRILVAGSAADASFSAFECDSGKRVLISRVTVLAGISDEVVCAADIGRSWVWRYGADAYSPCPPFREGDDYRVYVAGQGRESGAVRVRLAGVGDVVAVPGECGYFAAPAPMPSSGGGNAPDATLDDPAVDPAPSGSNLEAKPVP